MSATRGVKNPALPGADWPMLVHLLVARGHFRNMSALASAVGVSGVTMGKLLEGQMAPNRTVAYWLLKTARRRFAEPDKVHASMTKHEPQWFVDKRIADGGIAA